MERKYTRLLAIIAPVVAMTLVAVVVTGHLGKRVNAQRSAPTLEVGEMPSASTGPQPTTGGSATAALSRVSASDGPAARIIAASAEAALSGSPQAACRVGQQLMRCANIAPTLDLADTLAVVPASAMAVGGRSLSESLLEQAASGADHCAGINAEATKQAFAFQRVAASAGELKHRRWLVTSPALRQDRFMDDLDAWTVYRGEAERYVEQALRERSADDLPILIAIFAPDSYRGARPPYRVNDPAAFAALVTAATRSGVDVPGDLRRLADEVELHSGEQDPAKDRTPVLARSEAWNQSNAAQSFSELIQGQQADGFCD